MAAGLRALPFSEGSGTVLRLWEESAWRSQDAEVKGLELFCLKGYGFGSQAEENELLQGRNRKQELKLK